MRPGHNRGGRLPSPIRIVYIPRVTCWGVRLGSRNGPVAGGFPASPPTRGAPVHPAGDATSTTARHSMTAKVPATPLPPTATDVAPTILVIEDDPGVQTALQLLLEDEGYRVELAAEGAAGLARIVNGDVDLVLLDLMLPDMDGLEVCERARAQWSRFYPPIIMLTALSGLEQRRRGRAAGADDYITKPYDATMLLDRVQTWVRVRGH